MPPALPHKLSRRAKAIVQGAFHLFGVELIRLKTHHHDELGDAARLLGGAGTVRTIFDVGGYDGSAAARYRRTFPAAHVYTFEPTPSQFAVLGDRLKGDKGVTATQAAVGAASGVAELHQNADAQTNSLLPTDAKMSPRLGEAPAHVTQAKVSVPVVTLDGFCAERGIGTIDLLKLDIQGYELNALRGAGGLLGRGAIRVVHTEVLFFKFYEGQAYYHEIAAHLAWHGYHLYGLYHPIRGNNGVLLWADAMFVPAEVFAKLL